MAPRWIRRRLGMSARLDDDAKRKGWLITMHGAGTAIRRRERVAQYPPETVMRLGHR